MNYTVDVCDYCGKKVIKKSWSDSSDMVKTCDSFFYLCDLKRKESIRPHLDLMNFSECAGEDQSKMFCLDCLLEVITNWITEMKARGPSKIDRNDIIFPEGKVSSKGKTRSRI